MRVRSLSYPAKDLTRERWLDFCPDPFPSRGSVLYLPARGNLERRGYLARGLVLDQLVGAEHDDEEIGPVMANAQGVQIIHGPVRSAVDWLLEGRRGPLLAANLDFDGSHLTEVLDLLSVFRAFASDAPSYLGVTSYAGRGHETLLHGAVSRSKFYSALSDRAGVFFSQLGRILSRYEQMTAAESTRGALAEPDAHVSRELSLLWTVALATGVIRQGPQGFNIVDGEVIDRFDHLMAAIEAQFPAGMALNQWVMADVPELAQAMLSQPARWTIGAFERYAHLSDRGQPMRRFHFEIVPAPAGTSVRDVVQCAWEFAAETPLVYITKDGRTNSYG